MTSPRGKPKITRDNWNKSILEILYKLIFGLFPMWMGVILTILFGSKSSINQLIEYRQFVIFSTGLLATGFYCLGQEFKKAIFPARDWFLLGFTVLMLFSSAIFSGAAASIVKESESPFIESNLLRVISIVILIISTVFVFIVSLINKAQTTANITTEDVLEQHVGDIEKLDNEFDKLGR